MIFAYVGPETLLPMTSIVAGVAGVVLMFGRNTLRFVIRVFHGARRLGRPARKRVAPLK